MILRMQLVYLGRVLDERVLDADDADTEALLRKEALHDVFSPGRRLFGTWVAITEVRHESAPPFPG